MAGAFVADHARVTRRLFERVEVVHALEWPGGTEEVVAGLRANFDQLLASARLQGPGPSGPVTRVPVMITGGITVPQRAEAMVADVRTALGELRAPFVHGHVGYLGGLLAARLAPAPSRVFVTEHSTGLQALLQDPQGRDQYAEVLERAERVFCVSGVLRDQLLAAFPQHAATIEILPNPVDFDAVPCRPTPPAELLRWVFVGGLIARKGVERLVRAFCVIAKEDRRVELTMYGDGPLRPMLEDLASAAGVADRLHLRGVVPHAALLAELNRHDLLLAPSTYETFHLAVPEAVAAGLPVIVTRSGGPQEALAGVEDRVGRFIDVEDAPDQLIEAYRDLSANLSALDLAGARAELVARYGPAAVADRLATAYGVQPKPGGTTTVKRAAPPRRAVVLAGSGNRRQMVGPALDALADADVAVATSDAGLTELAWARSLEVIAPYLAMRMPPPTSALPLKKRIRRMLKPAPNVFGLRNRPEDVVVVTDCHGAAHVAALRTSLPRLTVAFDAVPWERG